MKRKVMSAIMALCLLVSTMGWNAMPALAEGEGTGCKHGEMLKLPDSGVINLEGNNYYLDEDLIISRPTTITFEKDASLCLNGFKIDADGHKLQINVAKGYEFRIFDCSNALREGHLDANGLWQEGKAEQDEVDMPIYGGAIIGAVSTMPLIQSYGTFYLESGNLVGNTNSATAIMRTQEQGIIVINGGMIMGNAASAIKVDTDTSGKTNGGIGEINGGIISNNKSSYATIQNKGTLTVIGGELTDNQSTEQAGGILCAKNATLKLSGNPLIKNNIGKDGRNNVYLEEKPIEITGALQSSAPIGIGMATLGPITNGWQTHMSGQAPSKYFSSDQTGLWVSEENDEAILTNQKPALKAPAITKQPQSLILTQGEGGTLSVEATAEEDATLSYQWYQAKDAASTENGTAIEGATDANLTIGADAPAGTTHYYCVVTASRDGETKTATSNIATVTVQKPEIKAPEIIKQPQDLNLKHGEGGTLSVEATAEEGATLSYQWYQAQDATGTENGTAIEGATDANLTIGADAPAGTTHYYCVVTASRGSETKTATSNIATVTVQKPEIKAPEIIKQPQDLNLKQGEGGTLSVEATAEEDATLSYQWYQAQNATSTENGTILDGATNASLAIDKNASAGTTYYYCVVTASRDGESKTTTSNIATVTVQRPALQAPVIKTQPQDLNLKHGEGGTLSVEATAEEDATLSYQWYQAKDATSTENGTLLKDATNASLAIDKNAPAGTTYYYCVVTASRDGESKTATSNIATVAVQRPALQAPVIKTQPQDLNLKHGEGGTLSVEATAEEDATLSYQWYQAKDATSTENGTLLKDATNASLAIDKNAPAGTTYYYCVVTASRDGESKTATSNIATVAVQRPALQAPVIKTQPQDLNLKHGEGGTLSVEATAEEGATLSYQWYQATDATSTENGTLLKDATDASLAIDKNAPAGTTYYYCVVTANRDGVAQSVKSAVATVMVDARPVSPDRPSKPKPPTEQPGETVTNPDGSVTTTVTKPNGMVVATTKYPNGDCMILSTAPSGEMDVTFEGAKERLVTIPVEALGPETVAYVTDANGMCRLEMRTAVTEMGMTILVHDGDSIELVQKTVNFTDVPDQHWAKAPITYVAARGLLIGVEDTLFAPSMQTSRAMIWSILARLEGVQLEETTPWYASSQAWAVDAAISDGNNPNAEISREQLVTMLYRYANSPAVNSDLTAYSDGSQVSAWAVNAVQWAVSEGIMNGITADTLAPQETATRAQTAAILERFIAWQLSVA